MKISIKNESVKVLIIEDEDLLREYLSDYLEDLGFVAHQAENGRIGIEKIRSGLADIVLTDLRMPEMGGMDVLSTMQSEFPEIPVIVISGTGTLQDVVKSMQLGAWDYLLKPLHDYNMLQLSLCRVIDRKKLIQENTVYREHLEDMVSKRSAELLKSNNKFKALFNLAGDAIFIHDLNGSILDINQQSTIYSGYTREELLQMNMRDLFTCRELRLFREHLDTIAGKSFEIYESVHRHRDGHEIPVEISSSLISIEDGSQVVAICRNISERKKAEEERGRLEKQFHALQKMETLGLLASGIAHDFNNILTALNGYAMLLKTQLKNNGDESEYIIKINDIVQMGQNITKRITTFIRKDKEELVPVDMHKVIADSVALLRPNCERIKIRFDLQATEVTVLGDESQMQNAFINLGINARDAMPGGGVILFKTNNRANLTGPEDVPLLVVEVQDTGTGMTKEVQERIFDPLFTTKEAGKGTGLGLTSVLYCVKNCHGEIDVESIPGKGTVFRLTFPVDMHPVQK